MEIVMYASYKKSASGALITDKFSDDKVNIEI